VKRFGGYDEIPNETQVKLAVERKRNSTVSGMFVCFVILFIMVYFMMLSVSQTV
jgi:hypothetical protein